MVAQAERRLRVRNFAQLEDIDVTFGDFTVLVGPQARGKSLALSLLKLAIDGKSVARTCRTYDLLFDGEKEFLDRYFHLPPLAPPFASWQPPESPSPGDAFNFPDQRRGLHDSPRADPRLR